MKFAQIGYGHDGRGAGKDGDGYTYLVNDNVRKEQIMQVIAHSPQNRAFATTGQVLTVHGKEPKNQKGVPLKIPDKVQQEGFTEAYTQKELGVTKGQNWGERRAQARFNALSVYNQEKLGGITGEEAKQKFAITGGTKTERLLSDGYESYAKYIERTNPWGENK